MTSQELAIQELEEKYKQFLVIMHSDPPKVAMIAAVDEEYGIGRDGAIPWHCPADMEMFQQLTQASTLIMGKRTYESIGHPLIDRHNIVVSSTLKTDLVQVCKTVEDAIACATTNSIYLIGGSDIYKEGLQYCDFMHLTMVSGTYKSDTFFPEIDPHIWGMIFKFELLDCDFVLLRKMDAEEQSLYNSISMVPS